MRNHSPACTSGESVGGICQDFIWGICSMGAQCRNRHELEFEAMKSVLKFCHYHQNSTGCTRPDCTYLHTSREEQSLFLSIGQIPKVLIDRYKGISSTPTPAAPVSGNVPSAPPRNHMMQLPHSSIMPVPAPMLGIPVALPPPPPPPLPTPISSRRMASPVYSSPLQHHQPSVYENELPQMTLPALFDPSRPPPPIPQNTPSSLLKRVSDYCEAGPSKRRKVESPNDICESCVQRFIRHEQLIHQMQEIEQKTEQARMDVVREMDRYEKKKRILRSILSPDMYRCAEELIENVTDPLSEHQLERLLDRSWLLEGDSTRGLIDMPSCSASDDIGLLAMALRAGPNSADYLNTLLELVRSERENARPPAGEAELSRPTAAGNGFSRYLGGDGGASPLVRPVYEASAPASLLTAASVRPFREAGAASASAPLPYGEVPPRYPPPPPPRPFPPPSVTAPPAQPPAGARPMFPNTHFAPNHMPTPPYPGAALIHPPRPPMPPPNNPYFMGGHYPNQHYYPPYQ